MAEPTQRGEQSFRGIPVSAGVCRGRILVIGRTRPSIGKRDLSEAELQDEVSRLERGLVQTRHQILEVQRRVTAEGLDIPIVFISGRASDDEERRARSAGAVDFLRKPVDTATLRRVLHEIVSKKRRP